MIETLVGWHAVNALIQRYPNRIQALYALDSLAPARLDALQNSGIKLNVLPKEQFFQTIKFDDAVAHQGVAALAEASSVLPEGALTEHLTRANPLILALDGVTDPRNLGAILRTARGRRRGRRDSAQRQQCGAQQRSPKNRLRGC